MAVDPMGVFICFQDRPTGVVSCGTASKDESLKRGDEVGVVGGNEGADPGEIPYLLLGFFVSLFFDSGELLGRGLASTVFDLMTRFSTVHAEIILASEVFLGLSERSLVLHGIEVHRPRTGGNRRRDGSGWSSGGIDLSD